MTRYIMLPVVLGTVYAVQPKRGRGADDASPDDSSADENVGKHNEISTSFAEDVECKIYDL